MTGKPALNRCARGFDTRQTARSGLRYTVVSCLSFFSTVVLTVIFHEVFGWPQELAYAVTLVAVTTGNFLMCRYFIFEARSANIFKQGIAFLAAAAGYRIAEYLSFLALHTILDLNYVAVVIAIQMLSFVSKFFFFKTFIFSVVPRVTDASTLEVDKPDRDQ